MISRGARSDDAAIDQADGKEVLRPLFCSILTHTPATQRHEDGQDARPGAGRDASDLAYKNSHLVR